MGRGLTAPCQEPQLRFTGLRVQPITELATLLMIDFKYRPIWSSHFFGFGERRKWTRWWRGGWGQCVHPRIFLARSAPGRRRLLRPWNDLQYPRINKMLTVSLLYITEEAYFPPPTSEGQTPKVFNGDLSDKLAGLCRRSRNVNTVYFVNRRCSFYRS